MKGLKLFFVLVITAFSFTNFSCEQEEECCVNPAVAEIHGNWEFVRAHFGFTNRTQTPKEIGYTERLEINGSGNKIRRYRNDRLVENTNFSLSKQGTLKIITFEEEQAYSYYTVFDEDGKVMLSLYERSPVGAVLADGGIYYYVKK